MKLKRLWMALLCAACLIGSKKMTAMFPNDVLVTMNGKPAITTEMIMKNFNNERNSWEGLLLTKENVKDRIIKLMVGDLILNEWFDRHKDLVEAAVEKTKRECPIQEETFLAREYFDDRILQSLSRTDEIKRMKEIGAQFNIIVHEDNLDALFKVGAEGPIPDAVLVSRDNKPLLTIQNFKDTIDEFRRDLKEPGVRFSEGHITRNLELRFYDLLGDIIAPLWAAQTLKNDADYQKSKQKWCNREIKNSKGTLFGKEAMARFGRDEEAVMNHYKKEYKIEELENNINKFAEQLPAGE